MSYMCSIISNLSNYQRNNMIAHHPRLKRDVSALHLQFLMVETKCKHNLKVYTYTVADLGFFFSEALLKIQ